MTRCCSFVCMQNVMNIKRLKGFDINLSGGNAKMETRHSRIQNVYCKTDISKNSKVSADGQTEANVSKSRWPQDVPSFWKSREDIIMMKIELYISVFKLKYCRQKHIVVRCFELHMPRVSKTVINIIHERYRLELVVFWMCGSKVEVLNSLWEQNWTNSHSLSTHLQTKDLFIKAVFTNTHAPTDKAMSSGECHYRKGWRIILIW